MKQLGLAIILAVAGCQPKEVTVDEVLQRRNCECWLWGSPRRNPDRPPVIAWYEKRIAQGCPEYQNCGICVVCGKLGHTSADPTDVKKDIELCNEHYVERAHE